VISRAYCNPIIGYTIPNSYRILSSDAPLLTWPSTVLVEEVAGPLSLNHVMKAFICQHRLRWRSLEVHLGCVQGSRELGYSNADRPWRRGELERHSFDLNRGDSRAGDFVIHDAGWVWRPACDAESLFE